MLKDYVLPFIKNYSTCWIENTKMIQSPWSNVCGMYCLFVLYQLKQGSNLQKILRLFSEQNLNQNDIKVSSWFESNFETKTVPSCGQICRCLTLTLFLEKVSYVPVFL